MEVFLEVWPDFLDLVEPSMSEEFKEIPEWFQCIFQKNVPQKVSKLKSFLSSCLMLIEDKDVIAELQAIIEEIPIEPWPKKKVNQVRRKFKTGHELRMAA